VNPRAQKQFCAFSGTKNSERILLIISIQTTSLLNSKSGGLFAICNLSFVIAPKVRRHQLLKRAGGL
jgi:hypothetical protein